MENLIESIRTATAAGATDEEKAAGATACRTLLIALEAKPGEPMAAPAPIPTQAPMPEIATIVAGLKGVPVDQLLDLAIAKLRTMVLPSQRPRRSQYRSSPSHSCRCHADEPDAHCPCASDVLHSVQ